MPQFRDYIPGDRLVDCDVCGFTYRVSQVQRGVAGKQKGLVVCSPCLDGVHPLETRVPSKQEGRLTEIR